MSKVTYNPPVTKTKVVEVEPATVSLTVSLDQAQALIALIGQSASGPGFLDLFEQLEEVLSEQSRSTRKYSILGNQTIQLRENARKT